MTALLNGDGLDHPDSFVDHLFAWMESKGQSRYDEAVSQCEHALQAAWQARESGACAALVIAALFHDIGHLLVDEHKGQGDFLSQDLCHERVGANWLATLFPAAVSEPVRLHVPAKRWLCAGEAGYVKRLSLASQRSLQIQGGPMSPAEKAAFEKEPHWKEAVQLRLWDDEAKVTGRQVPGFDDYLAPCATLISRMPSRTAL
ncbi:MAG: HD family phosphohydrolase [Pseudomonadota bacterium]